MGRVRRLDSALPGLFSGLQGIMPIFVRLILVLALLVQPVHGLTGATCLASTATSGGGTHRASCDCCTAQAETGVALPLDRGPGAGCLCAESRPDKPVPPPEERGKEQFRVSVFGFPAVLWSFAAAPIAVVRPVAVGGWMPRASSHTMHQVLCTWLI